MKKLILLLAIASSFTAYSSDIDTPVPDNPMPIPPPQTPTQPQAETPFYPQPSAIENGAKNRPLSIEKGDLTINEMNKLRQFGKQKLDREVRFSDK